MQNQNPSTSTTSSTRNEYPHQQKDLFWQKEWERRKAFVAEENSKKPKYYALDMFPYPSGAGLHIGHMVSYTPTDIISRYKRARGFNVLHPMGYDAFGLPAEQYAIQTGVHPALTTAKSIETFREQLKSFGFSFDWSREVSTCDPEFYKWTQFIFGKLFEMGLAYQKEVPVNWCPELRTVLANEEVVDGKSERGGHPVVRVPMKQWMLKITGYAERLLADLDKVDWPQRTVDAQRKWIGKSEGANVRFEVSGHAGKYFEIFTTRPDTLFGVTFMVISPEHPMLAEICSAAQKSAVDKYVQAAASKSEVDRKASVEKTGVFTGAEVLHPFTGQKIPVWTADYVLMDYGTGAIMAVPAHDERDFEFAREFKLNIVRVLNSPDENADNSASGLPFSGDGILVNSDFLNGLKKSEAIAKVIETLEARKIGERCLQYKLRDWLFSRQRYWGEPFPIVHFADGSTGVVPVEELPVVLPEVADYQPTEKGEPPLARSKEWVNYTGKAHVKASANSSVNVAGRRETDTMPGSAGSSWYFLRYCDPKNQNAAFADDKQKYWMPVDLYVGGPEHTVGHLLYARFWQKVLFDLGLVSHDEPFKKLAHQGMLLGPDGEKMSKSRGNVVNPDDMRRRYGADSLRMYLMFMGPMDRDKPWSETGVEGVQRFLDRVWRLAIGDDGQVQVQDQELPTELQRTLHKTIKKVGDDIEILSFNTAISAMMILVNETYKAGLKPRAVLEPLLQILAPFAPHFCEELWHRLGHTDLVALAPWPKFEEALTVDSQITLGVQVNGKSRGTIDIDKEAPESDAVAAAMKVPAIANALGGKTVDKVIYKAGRILNLIVKM